MDVFTEGEPATHVSEVEGDLQVPPEVLGELGVHVQHLLNVLSQDLVEVAVGQRPHVSAGLPRSGLRVYGLAENIILAWRGMGRGRGRQRGGKR